MHKNLLRGTRGIDWFEFVASTDGAGVNLVTPAPSCASHWFVSINGERTDMPADSLSFKENDVVRVTYGGWVDGTFSARDKDYCREVRGVLPRFLGTYADAPFANCRSLQKIDGMLFRRYRYTKTESWFSNCTSLEELPEGCLKNQGGILPLYLDTFSNCKALKKADPDLMWNPGVDWYNFPLAPRNAFADCTQLVAEFRINALGCPGRFSLAPRVPEGQITVHVIEGTEFTRMLKAGGNENLNIIEDL